jgi:hypothetical protein
MDPAIATGLTAFVVIFGGFSLVIGIFLFFAEDIHIQLLNHLERRRKLKTEAAKYEKDKAIELARINKELEIEKARIDDAYWRDLSGISKRPETLKQPERRLME